jgi:peptide/nickel transport system ATP-binding protein
MDSAVTEPTRSDTQAGMAPSAHLLDVDNLTVSFMTPGGSVPILDGVSFRIPHRKTVALVGESGSGKSVTAQIIMGLQPRIANITAGHVLFRDPLRQNVQDLTKIPLRSPDFRAIRGGRIAMVFQEPMTSMSPLHRVGFQIQEALELHSDLRGVAAKARVIDMLKLVRFPDPERGYRSYPFELSGGLRQRAMLAMALIGKPALLVADEPTTALDVTVQAQVLGLIRDLQAELGMSVLMITHDMGVVANMADEVVVMYRGAVMERGTVEDIFASPSHPYLRSLLAAVPRIETDPAQPLRTLAGAGPNVVPLRPQATGLRHLEVTDLGKSYLIRADSFGLFGAKRRTVSAVDGVSFHIDRGECLGLVGESGSGKTTVAKMIARAHDPDVGSILLHGLQGAVDIAKLPAAAMGDYRRRIQYVFQDPFGALNARMTVLDVIGEPLKVQGIGDAQARRLRVQELLELVGLDRRFLNRYPHSFSGGQRQRIGIARALALEPELLILDEPVSALDVSTQAQILNLLTDLRARLGLSYLFITHNLAVVSHVAERIAVMCSGRLVELAPRTALFTNARHPYTRALLASAPEPDLSRKLDFVALRSSLATDPKTWPAPYAERSDGGNALIEVAPGHFVRMQRDSIRSVA